MSSVSLNPRVLDGARPSSFTATKGRLTAHVNQEGEWATIVLLFNLGEGVRPSTGRHRMPADRVGQFLTSVGINL